MARQTWTVNALADELGIDRRTLGKRLKGVEPADTQSLGNRTVSRYHLVDVVQALIDACSGSGDAVSEKARLDRARADQVEFDLAIKRGQYAPIDALQMAVADMASQARSIIEGLPKRIKNSLPSLRAREIKILETELVKARRSLSEIQCDFDTEGDS